MSKAIYSEKNIGHFGLVLDNYAHFTSPIRRYPDLAIHRILSSYLAGSPKEKLKKRYGSFVPAASKNASQMEQNAMNIERDCEDCYKAEYMSGFIGQSFTGRITGVTSFGFFVELENSVEGLVSINDLPVGDYQLEEGIELKDSLSGNFYRIGSVAAGDSGFGGCFCRTGQLYTGIKTAGLLHEVPLFCITAVCHHDMRAIFVHVFLAGCGVAVFEVEALCLCLCTQSGKGRTLGKLADFFLAGTQNQVADFFTAVVFQHTDATQLPNTVGILIDAGGSNRLVAVIDGQVPADLVQIIKFYLESLFDNKDVGAHKKSVVAALFPLCPNGLILHFFSQADSSLKVYGIALL